MTTLFKTLKVEQKHTLIFASFEAWLVALTGVYKFSVLTLDGKRSTLQCCYH